MPPPTVQNTAVAQKRPSGGPSQSRTAGGGKEKAPTDLLLRVRYQNTLPDIPFEPKFLVHPFVDLSRFVGYKQTQLEKNFKYDLLTEPDLGVKIDLINPETYASLGEVEPHPTDAKLLEDEPQNTTNTKRSEQHKRVLPWLRKTELMSSEINRFGVQTERQETKVGYKIKKQLQQQDQEQPYRSIQDQIAAIEKSFEDNQRPVHTHHSKKDVYPVEEMHFLPDFDLWKYPFAQVLFDSDPTPNDPRGRAQDKMCQALIRGMMDEEGEQYVAYFLPTDDTLTKIEKQAAEKAAKAKNPDAEQSTSKQNEDGENGEKPPESGEKEAEPAADKPEEEGVDEYEYKIAREYHWTVKAKASKGYEQENYFVTLRNGVAAYNELETRVRLTRRRARGEVKSANQRLVVKYRPETISEMNAQQQRVHMLFNPYEEFEGMEEEEEEEPEPEQPAAEESMETEEPSTTAAAPANKTISDDEDSDDEQPAQRQKDASSSSPPPASTSAAPAAKSSAVISSAESSDDSDNDQIKAKPAAAEKPKEKSKPIAKSSSEQSSSDDDTPAPSKTKAASPPLPTRPVRPTAPKKSMPAMKAMKSRQQLSSDDSDSSSDNPADTTKEETKDTDASSDDSDTD